jgi:hypothetical protein
VAIPDDYTRARIRCPACGVMSDVPATAQKKPADKPVRPAASAPREAAAEEILLAKDVPPPVREKPAKRKPTPAIQAERPKPRQPLHPPPPSPNANATDEDDGRPYRVPGLDEVRPCPECGRAMPRDAVLCAGCGYNLETGQKAKREFEPVERQWQGGLPAKTRLGLFIGVQVVFLLLVIIGLTQGVPAFGVVCPWLLFALMTAFLLGTYDRIFLKRNKKGRVRLTKMWTCCFVPIPPHEVDVHEYGDVSYGPHEEQSFLEWLVLLVLFICGIIPGLIWLYFVFIRVTFQVALTKQHGHDELVLYRGSNQQMVVDIAETIREVAFRPWMQVGSP